jgi:hypothetical protein
LGLAGIFVFAFLAGAANDPWTGKPYQKWDEKDVQRILTDSPWAHIVTVTRRWSTLKPGELPEGALSGGRRGLSTEAGLSNDPISSDSVNFGIFWMSSRVTRAATARRAILQSRMNEATAMKYVELEQPEYEIVVQSNDMTPFAQKDEAFCKENSFLQVRRMKERVPPSHVLYQRGPDRQSLYAVKFYFPKKTPAGKLVISPDEKVVEFTCKLEGPTLRANFEPVKMVDQNGSALLLTNYLLSGKSIQTESPWREHARKDPGFPDVERFADHVKAFRPRPRIRCGRLGGRSSVEEQAVPTVD